MSDPIAGHDIRFAVAVDIRNRDLIRPSGRIDAGRQEFTGIGRIVQQHGDAVAADDDVQLAGALKIREQDGLRQILRAMG